MTDEAVEVQLIHYFGAQPNSEQDEILRKLRNLQQTLLTTFIAAEPLIDLGAVCPERFAITITTIYKSL